MKRLLALFFLIIFFAACNSDGAPDGIINQDRMVKVLTDIHLADGYASVNYGDTSKQQIKAMYLAIYKKYNTDSLQVRKSLEFYSMHADRLKTIYEQVSAALLQLEKTQQQIDEQRMKIQDQRMRDSVRFEELKRDTLNKGFIIDTTFTFPLRMNFKAKGTAILEKKGQVKADTLKKEIKRDTLRGVKRPLKRLLLPYNRLKKETGKNDLSAKRNR